MVPGVSGARSREISGGVVLAIDARRTINYMCHGELVTLTTIVCDSEGTGIGYMIIIKIEWPVVLALVV